MNLQDYIKKSVKPVSLEDQLNHEMYQKMMACRSLSCRDPKSDLRESIEVIDKMINMEDFKNINDNPIIDICCGRGTYLFRWWHRLFNRDFKNQISDPIKRDKFIREEFLYGLDIEPAFIHLLKPFFPNCLEKNSLELKNQETNDKIFNINHKDMKFSANITNPPYSIPYNGKSKNMEAIYPKFVELGNHISDINIQIFPVKGFIHELKEAKAFRKRAFDFGIEIIKIYEEKYVKTHMFPDVTIREGLCITKFKKGHFLSTVVFINNKGEEQIFEGVDLRKNPDFLKYKDLSLFKKLKIQSSFKDKHVLGFTNTKENYFQSTQTTSTDLIIFVSKQKSRTSYLFMDSKHLSSNKRNVAHNNWKTKLLLVDGNLKNISVCKPGEIFSYSYCGFIHNSEEECLNFISLCKTKPINIIYDFHKKYHNQNTGNLFQYIPLLDLSHPWTDKEVYNYFEERFNITPEDFHEIYLENKW